MSKFEHVPVTFRAGNGFVEAVFQGEKNQRVTLRLDSPEQVLELFKRMMDMAAVVWPENEWINDYLSDEA